MADIIEVNFRKKQRVQKYTINKYLCGNCLKNFVRDSRREDNPKFILFECGGGHGLCVECANKVKGALDEQGW